MKRYRISVNGQSYDVTVEELGAVRGPASAQAAPAPAPAPSAAPAAQSAAPAAASVPSAGTVEVKAPMPGTLVSYKVDKGQAVNAGQVLLILEAMKMENEIVAPRAGVVAALRVAPGSSVNTGDALVDLA
jgi:glutaconyl-CoA decarboxylase